MELNSTEMNETRLASRLNENNDLIFHKSFQRLNLMLFKLNKNKKVFHNNNNNKNNITNDLENLF